MPDPLRFRLLGPLQVQDGDREIAVPAARHRAVLAALLLRADRVVTVDELITLVWGADPPGDARATTQTYVRRLRGVLGDGVIHTRPGGYQLPVAAGQLDVSRFDELVARAGSAGDPTTEAALLQEALALWRGPAMVDVPSDVLHRDDVPALTERRLRALERRIDLDLDADRHGDLVAELRRLTAEHPLRERFWAQLMTALAGSGRAAEALQVYRDVRTRLAEELGTDPGLELQRLHRAILRGAVPERPGPGAAPVPPAQLPSDVAAFTGREAQLRRLDALLPAGDTDPPAAVVISALEGMGGIGKTALAVHWAHRVRHRFPDGQLYVNLRGYAPGPPVRPIEALAGFLRTLGVRADLVPTELDEAAALYRSRLADKRVLVLLDNAAHPDQVRPLLPGAGHSLVLVTSRDRMAGLVARDGATALTLDVLPAAEAHALLARLLPAEQARAAPETIAELAELCGHVPLALRIAAANVTSGPRRGLASYLDRLRDADRLAALTVAGDPRAAVPATFDLSYHRMPAATRRLFRLLGLAPGPDATTDAAAALAGAEPAAADELLAELARAHLIEEHAPGRYTLHDLLRRYAADRARAEEAGPDRQAARDRLYAYYLHTADAAATVLYPEVLRLPKESAPVPVTAFADDASALAWLDGERHNLAATVADAASGGNRRVAWLITDAMRGYFYMRLHTVDWLGTARTALTAAEADGDLPAQAAAHLSIANLRARQNRHREAIDHVNRALELTRKAGWMRGEAVVLGNLGPMLSESGMLAQAVASMTAALAMHEQIGSGPSHRAPCLHNLSNAYAQMGRLAEATEHASRGLAMNREIGARNGEASNHAVLGDVYLAGGRIDEAIEHLGQALALYSAVGNDGGAGFSRCGLARAYRDIGRHAEAFELAYQALATAGDDDPRLTIEARYVLASIHHRCQELAQARAAFEHTLELVQEPGDSFVQAEALVGLADTYRRLGLPDRAHARLRDALTLIRRAGFRLVEGQALTVLAATHLDTGDMTLAVDHAGQALAIHRETGRRLGEARALLVLGEAHRRIGDDPAGTSQLQAARALFTELGVPQDPPTFRERGQIFPAERPRSV